jgi:hypothetical protein
LSYSKDAASNFAFQSLAHNVFPQNATPFDRYGLHGTYRAG